MHDDPHKAQPGTNLYRAVIFFKIILYLGFVFSLVIIADAILPTRVSEHQVIDIFQGEEHGYSQSGAARRINSSFLTHFRVKLTDEQALFPIFRSDFSSFKAGQKVRVSKSRILRKWVKIKNVDSGVQSIPAIGFYSYFFVIPFLLFVVCGIGVRLRNNDNAVLSIGVFLFLLIPFTIYLWSY